MCQCLKESVKPETNKYIMYVCMRVYVWLTQVEYVCISVLTIRTKKIELVVIVYDVTL